MEERCDTPEPLRSTRVSVLDSLRTTSWTIHREDRVDVQPGESGQLMKLLRSRPFEVDAGPEQLHERIERLVGNLAALPSRLQLPLRFDDQVGFVLGGADAKRACDRGQHEPRECGAASSWQVSHCRHARNGLLAVS